MTEKSVAEIKFIPATAIVSRVVARSVKAEGVDRLRSKIERLGFQADKPLRVYPVDGGYRLIDGNHRLEAAIKLSLATIPALIVAPPADELAEIQQARESNEASETVVPTTFIDDAELVWKLTETFTQEQTAKAMGWNTRVDVSRYKALRVLKDADVWDEVIVPTFNDLGTTEESEEGTANVPTGTRSVFTERLLREILDLDPGQQLSLCQELAKGEKKGGISKGKFKNLANAYRARNEMMTIVFERLAGVDSELLQSTLDEISKGIYDDDWLKRGKSKGKPGEEAGQPAFPDSFLKLLQGALDAWQKKTSIQLMHGDFYECVKQVPADSIDLILTDPPYNIAHSRIVTRYNASDIEYDFGAWDRKGEADFMENMKEWTTEFARILKPGGTGVIFTSSAFISDLRRLLVEAGLKPKQDLYWCKTNPAPTAVRTGYYTAVEVMVLFIKGESGQTFNWPGDTEAKNYFVAPICQGNERLVDANKKTLHPTQKPESLIKRLMENSSYKNDVVFDGFMGVGTTAKVAKDLGRKFVGIELDDEYFAAAQRRIA